MLMNSIYLRSGCRSLRKLNRDTLERKMPEPMQSLMLIKLPRRETDGS